MVVHHPLVDLSEDVRESSCVCREVSCREIDVTVRPTEAGEVDRDGFLAREDAPLGCLPSVREVDLIHKVTNVFGTLEAELLFEAGIVKAVKVPTTSKSASIFSLARQFRVQHAVSEQGSDHLKITMWTKNTHRNTRRDEYIHAVEVGSGHACGGERDQPESACHALPISNIAERCDSG